MLASAGKASVSSRAFGGRCLLVDTAHELAGLASRDTRPDRQAYHPAVRRAIVFLACLISLGGCGRSATSASITRCITHYARTRTEPSHFSATYEASTDATTVSWNGPVYPPLPKTELNLLGSGVASYAYRYRVGDGRWSTWQKTKGPEDPEFVLAQTKLGARVAAEVIATDDAGHRHPPVDASLRSEEPETAAEAEAPSADVGEECGEVAMYPE